MNKRKSQIVKRSNFSFTKVTLENFNIVLNFLKKYKKNPTLQDVFNEVVNSWELPSIAIKEPINSYQPKIKYMAEIKLTFGEKIKLLFGSKVYITLIHYLDREAAITTTEDKVEIL